MQVIILAAGLGSRLGDLTERVPKAMIEVDGVPLVRYAIEFARSAGGTELSVVSGFGGDEVAGFVSSVDSSISIAHNDRFREGNIISLVTGLGSVDVERGFLLMNTDHIYKPAIADVIGEVARKTGEVTGFCDFDRELGADDMKVGLDADRRIAEIAKTLTRWDAGYVGMTFVPSSRALGYRAEIDAVIADRGTSVHVESILARLAGGEQPPHIADISGHGWLEIDEPHERERAERTLAAERWWPSLGR